MISAKNSKSHFWYEGGIMHKAMTFRELGRNVRGWYFTE